MQLGKLVNLQEYKDNNEIGNVCELICIFCKYRFIGWVNQDDKLKELECPECNKHNGIIFTGEHTEDSEDLKKWENAMGSKPVKWTKKDKRLKRNKPKKKK